MPTKDGKKKSKSSESIKKNSSVDREDDVSVLYPYTVLSIHIIIV